MNLLALSVVLAVSAAPAVEERPDPVKDDLDKLQGTWIVVYYEKDGIKRDAEGLKNTSRLTIKGNQYTWSNGSQPGSISLDPTKSPKHVDYTITDGDAKGQVEKSIYAITGDTWRDCIAPNGKDRPSEFAAPAGSGYTLVVYRRAK